jgi:hypothetical protein
MKYERYYSIYEDDDLGIFEFMSIGKNGVVRKRIEFAKTETKGVYSLAFGNVRVDGSLDDQDISDNGDRNKVLATVAGAVDRYTIRYPRRWIYFCGNTPAKTRLYRIAVGLNLEDLSKTFEIFAAVEGQENYIPFQKNMEIEGLLIRRKIILFP